MYCVCIEKATGKIIESQNGSFVNESTIQLVLDNVKRAGWDENLVSCSLMNEAQYQDALTKDPFTQNKKKEISDELAKKEKAKTDILSLIGSENKDPTKWKIEEIVSHIKLIETLLGVRT